MELLAQTAFPTPARAIVAPPRRTRTVPPLRAAPEQAPRPETPVAETDAHRSECAHSRLWPVGLAEIWTRAWPGPAKDAGERT